MKDLALLLVAISAISVAGPEPIAPVQAADLSGHKLLVTSVRTGDTEVFIADPTVGDMFNVTRSPHSEDRYPCWSPDSNQIVYSFPVGDALELFVVNADGTANHQLTRFAGPSVCTPSAWSPDGKWISFRRTDERYWSNPVRMRLVYAEKPADKRPVWVIRPNGTEATLVEPLHFQMAIDGSRANWRPIP